PPSSTPLPYTTLFRSSLVVEKLVVPLAVVQGILQVHLVLQGTLPVRQVLQEIRRLQEIPLRLGILRDHRGILVVQMEVVLVVVLDRKSTRLNSSHVKI